MSANKLDDAVRESQMSTARVIMAFLDVPLSNYDDDSDMESSIIKLGDAIDRWRIARDNVRALLPRQQG